MLSYTSLRNKMPQRCKLDNIYHDFFCYLYYTDGRARGNTEGCNGCVRGLDVKAKVENTVPPSKRSSTRGHSNVRDGKGSKDLLKRLEQKGERARALRRYQGHRT